MTNESETIKERFEKEFGTKTDYFNHRFGLFEEVKDFIDKELQEYSSIQKSELFKKIKDIGDEFITKENNLDVNLLLARLLTRIESLNTK